MTLNTRNHQHVIPGGRPNSLIRTIDYNHLAELERRTGVPFDLLCERAENGATSDDELISRIGVHPPTDTWLLHWQACAVLGIKPQSFYCSISRNGHYSGVRWKSRSRVNSNSKRGCGVLFHRADLERLRHIKTSAQINWTAAAKIFHAMQRGLI